MEEVGGGGELVSWDCSVHLSTCPPRQRPRTFIVTAFYHVTRPIYVKCTYTHLTNVTVLRIIGNFILEWSDAHTKCLVAPQECL
jgi:hypothetical protein